MTIGALWLAILVASVLVFVASSIAWTVSPHHKKDFGKLPNEDAARDALRSAPVGAYFIPWAEPADQKKPEVQQRFADGPVGVLTVMPNGVPNMGKAIASMFIFCVVVSVFVAYLASRTLPADASYLAVFRLTGTVAFLAYGMGHIPNSVWFGQPWSNTAKGLFDALVYGGLTGGAFGWLWG